MGLKTRRVSSPILMLEWWWWRVVTYLGLEMQCISGPCHCRCSGGIVEMWKGEVNLRLPNITVPLSVSHIAWPRARSLIGSGNDRDLGSLTNHATRHLRRHRTDIGRERNGLGESKGSPVRREGWHSVCEQVVLLGGDSDGGGGSGSSLSYYYLLIYKSPTNACVLHVFVSSPCYVYDVRALAFFWRLQDPVGQLDPLQVDTYKYMHTNN